MQYGTMALTGLMSRLMVHFYLCGKNACIGVALGED